MTLLSIIEFVVVTETKLESFSFSTSLSSLFSSSFACDFVENWLKCAKHGTGLSSGKETFFVLWDCLNHCDMLNDWYPQRTRNV